jgi:hypothetical protein
VIVGAKIVERRNGNLAAIEAPGSPIEPDGKER